MKALVTGGAGFIGSTLVDRLLADGHDVVVIDSLVSGKMTNLEGALAEHPERLVFHEIDIRDPKTTEIVAETRPEVVFHLAAQMDVRVSVAQPVYDAEVNVIGALRVLEGARSGGTRRVLFASSGGTIYGDNEAFVPFDENAPQAPLSPYGITKKVFNDYLRAYSEMYDMDNVSLALGNVFGPRQDPHGEAGVVAIFAQRLLAGESCKIFGDGESTRDYVFVEDVVNAFVLAAEKGSGLYNIGTGVETSVNTLYRTIADAAGVKDDAVHEAARTGELQRVGLNNGRAQADLGWAPEVSFEEGAKRVVEYFKAR